MTTAQSQNEYVLPSPENEDYIVLLPRDPHWLYAFWEISPGRKENFIQDLGKELWDKSIPVLRVNNISGNESFHVRINEFSDHWFIYITDPGSLYVVEIGRMVQGRFFIGLAASNCTAVPGDGFSSKSTACFMNYRDLANGKAAAGMEKIYETYQFKLNAVEMLGISSPELFSRKGEEIVSGIGSSELSGTCGEGYTDAK